MNNCFYTELKIEILSSFLPSRNIKARENPQFTWCYTLMPRLDRFATTEDSVCRCALLEFPETVGNIFDESATEKKISQRRIYHRSTLPDMPLGIISFENGMLAQCATDSFLNVFLCLIDLNTF